MRHSVFGRKLSRTKNERRRLFAGLIRDLLIRDSVTTTVAKAKSVQPLIEKLITKARTGTEANRRRVLATLTDRSLTEKLFEYAKTRFSARTSGFTRIIKAGLRRGDATQTAILSFVDERIIAEVVKPVASAPKTLKKPKIRKSPKLLKKAKKS